MFFAASLIEPLCARWRLLSVQAGVTLLIGQQRLRVGGGGGGGWRTERALFEDNKGLLTGSDSDSGSLYEIF